MPLEAGEASAGWPAVWIAIHGSACAASPPPTSRAMRGQQPSKAQQATTKGCASEPTFHSNRPAKERSSGRGGSLRWSNMPMATGWPSQPARAGCAERRASGQQWQQRQQRVLGWGRDHLAGVAKRLLHDRDPANTEARLARPWAKRRVWRKRGGPTAG